MSVLLSALLVTLLVTAHPDVHAQGTADPRHFPQTDFRIGNDAIWEYFQSRGGVDTFGYPVGNTFRLRGFPVQIFQRHMIQVVGDEARPVNLLDPTTMPLTKLNGSTFPAHDQAIAASAPSPSTSNYGEALREHLEVTVPNTWEDESVGFRNYFYSAAPTTAPALESLVALEVWGFPTSAPMRDPTNDNFIYQRFQRGIMHYDATQGVTRGILLGDAFKSLLTGENLPSDLANDQADSPFLRLYDPDDPQGLARTEPALEPPITRQNSDLSSAFMSAATTDSGTSSMPASRVGVQELASGLTAPLYLAEPPDGSGRLFVVDQIGVIRIIGATGELIEPPFLDIRRRVVPLQSGYDERGLLGFAFHPDYATNGRFFVYYSGFLRPGAPNGWDHTSHVSEFRVSSSDPNRADPDSERVILSVDQPQANHNGGTLKFGPDGYLYISLGDGGGANDVGLGHPPQGNGQDRTTILGNILRIDVNGPQPYGVPADNPFVGREGVDEIYAYGFRNPYRFSFDRETGELYAADAGQNLFEEVSRVGRGGNYGWNIREATHCFDPTSPSNPPPTCANTGPRGEPLLGPVIEYPHASQTGPAGLAVVGGYLYRGDALPSLQGQYLFGDWSQRFNRPDGQLLAATPTSSGLWSIRQLSIVDTTNGELGHFVLGFGEDNAGEIYILASQATGPTGTSGKVFKVVSAE